MSALSLVLPRAASAARVWAGAARCIKRHRAQGPAVGASGTARCLSATGAGAAAAAPPQQDRAPAAPKLWRRRKGMPAEYFTCDPIKVAPALLPFYSRAFQEEVAGLGQLATMIRRPGSTISYFLAAQSGKVSHRFLLDSGNLAGTGKSMTLMHAVQHALEERWIVVMVPNALDWIVGDTTSFQQSRYKPERLDQNADARNWLEDFLAWNETLTDEFPITGRYDFGKWQEAMEGANLTKLAKLGVADFNMATDVVGMLLKELRASQDVPVLVAVDDFNALLLDRTTHHDMDGQPVSPDKLALVRNFAKFASEDSEDWAMSRGLVVGAAGFPSGVPLVESSREPWRRLLVQCGPRRESPKRLLESQERLSAVLHVGPYSRVELLAAYKYNRSRGWIPKAVGNEAEALQELHLLTDSLPREVARVFRAM